MQPLLRLLTISALTLVLIAGCGREQPGFPVISGEPANQTPSNRPKPGETLPPATDHVTDTKPSTQASDVPKTSQFDGSAPPAISPRILELSNSSLPKEKREAGKLLGELLRQSLKRHANTREPDQTNSQDHARTTPPPKQSDALLVKPNATLSDHDRYQLAIFNTLRSLGPLALDAVPVLSEVLRDPAAPIELKRQVLELVEGLGTTGRRMGRELAIASFDMSLKSQAIQAIIKLGCDDSASVAALGQALRVPELRERSLAALKQLNSSALTPASRYLVELAATKELEIRDRVAAIEVIGRFNRSNIPELFYDENLEIRKAMARSGVVSGSLLVLEENPEVLDAAFEGLARPPIEVPRLAEVFGQALKKEELRPRVRKFLISHPQIVVQTLAQLFQSDSTLVRGDAVDMFAELELSPPINASLEKLLQDSNSSGFDILAAIKLVQIPPSVELEPFSNQVGKWVSHPKLRPAALELLSGLGKPAVVTLAELVTDSRLTSDAKVDVLKRIAVLPDVDEIAVPVLEIALQSEDPGTRHWAVATLVKFLGQSAPDAFTKDLPVLKESLQSADPILVRQLLELLTACPNLVLQLSAELVGTLKHAEPSVRMAAIQCFTKSAEALKRTDVQTALKECADNDLDPEVKKLASAARQTTE